MKEAFGALRPILLAASLACLIIATLLGFQIVEVAQGKTLLLTCGWGFWGAACYVGSKIAGELSS